MKKENEMKAGQKVIVKKGFKTAIDVLVEEVKPGLWKLQNSSLYWPERNIIKTM